MGFINKINQSASKLWQITAVVLHFSLFQLTTFVIAVLVIIILETTITFLGVHKAYLFMRHVVCTFVGHSIWLIYLYKTQNIGRLFGPPIHFQKKDSGHVIFTILTTCIMMVIEFTLIYIENKYLPQDLKKVIMPPCYNYVVCCITCIIGFITPVCLAPFTEELLFRGFLINRLYTITANKWLATLISSVLFSLMHYSREADNFSYFIHFIQGCFMSFIYFKTNHIIYSITAHAINNLIAILLSIFQ